MNVNLLLFSIHLFIRFFTKSIILFTLSYIIILTIHSSPSFHLLPPIHPLPLTHPSTPTLVSSNFQRQMSTPASSYHENTFEQQKMMLHHHASLGYNNQPAMCWFFFEGRGLMGDCGGDRRESCIDAHPFSKIFSNTHSFKLYKTIVKTIHPN